MPTTTQRKKKRTSSGRSRLADPTSAYARDVVAGRIVAGHLVRAACQRHLSDKRTGKRRGLTWSAKAANHAIGFFRDVLRLNGGEFEGAPFVLEPWESFIVGSLFGWLRADGTRRFRLAYLEIGKGNAPVLHTLRLEHWR